MVTVSDGNSKQIFPAIPSNVALVGLKNIKNENINYYNEFKKCNNNHIINCNYLDATPDRCAIIRSTIWFLVFSDKYF